MRWQEWPSGPQILTDLVPFSGNPAPEVPPRESGQRESPWLREQEEDTDPTDTHS